MDTIVCTSGPDWLKGPTFGRVFGSCNSIHAYTPNAVDETAEPHLSPEYETMMGVNTTCMTL
ncbi:MAG: hypothetical protein GDA36_06510 [Rhodobacteraceae bacterium]|nr:hypothetical protein [Paracoccaceae bacterium]